MKVKPCPFCGHQPDIDDLDVLYPTGTLWRYDPELELRTYHSHREYKDGDNSCYKIVCNESQGGCGVQIHGDSVEEVIRKWETRI